MASSPTDDLVDRFTQFYRNYYRDEIGRLAQRYPSEQRSLHVDYDDLYQFDPDLAEDFLAQPDQLGEFAEEALRVYDLPADVSLGQAHVRLRNLPDTVDIRSIRVHDNHVGRLIAVSGIIRKATDVRPKIVEAAFECQRCGTMTYIPQTEGGFQEPHECQGCERQGPFRVNYDQSEFVDSQKLRVQESPEGLRGGETPQSIDVDIEDDITGEVTAGDHVTVTGVLHIDQVTDGNEKSQLFDLYMDGVSVEIEDEQFEDMEITEADKREIVELSNHPDIYEEMVASVAPSIYGYDEEKLAMILQLFAGVTKDLPDGSRIRGDLHMLLIGDPGTGKCLKGDTKVALEDGREVPIRDLVERNLDDPTPVDDGVYDETDIGLVSVTEDGTVTTRQATRVWKREAPERLYRIRTASGREIETTPSHPLFVQASGHLEATRADELAVGDPIAVRPSDATAGTNRESVGRTAVVPDGGPATTDGAITHGTNDVIRDRIESIEAVEPDDDWVYDLEVAGTHTYLANGIVSHNSQLLSYIRNIAPRSVYTSGKGSSSAGLTAAAVRDDFGEGQQWSLEAGALVLADQGIAAVDELDKMRCVTGDTLVHLADGTVQRIEELTQDAAATGTIEELDTGRTIRDVDLDAWTMTDDGRIVSRPVTAIHEYEAPEQLTDVRLETGERLTSTADHPFFVFEDGERVERGAADLKEGDRVYVPRDLPQPMTDGGANAFETENSVFRTDAASELPDEYADSEDVILRRVTSVEIIDAGEQGTVYDLTVEGTHNFVANGMVVHNSEDRSAMHQALEQQEISISKAGINATLKSRCSLLGAANPKYGRFDQYEPIGEQIDLEPALISRFDLIFTVTDQPDPEEDAALADHILRTNYAGELNTQRAEVANSNHSQAEVEEVTDTVEPAIEPDLLRKYIAYSKRTCYPTMSDEAKAAIREFYVDLRAKGADEDAPVPVTARKLEALVRLAEASARVRLSDTVAREDADRVIDIVRSCLQDIGVDPETGEFDADVIETGTSKSQRDRIKSIKDVIETVDAEYEGEAGAPIDAIVERAEAEGIEEEKVMDQIEGLRRKGDVYSPSTDQYKVV
ncbi:cell division protein [Haloplanus salilacus]|uniref:cell division protein n=1 Tax=Haloplanus salilacus TaxID=2949994 RepID=UPI0030D58A04